MLKQEAYFKNKIIKFRLKQNQNIFFNFSGKYKLKRKCFFNF